MIISVTGHRPDKLGGYSIDAHNKLIEIAKVFLTNNKNKITKVLTGMCIGWDQAIAFACIELQIPYIAVLPFKGQELKWPKQSQDYYNYLLNNANETVVVSEGEYTAAKMFIRNHYLVDNSHLVLCLFNGDEKGGTAECFKYAKFKEKLVVNLYPNYLKYEL